LNPSNDGLVLAKTRENHFPFESKRGTPDKTEGGGNAGRRNSRIKHRSGIINQIPNGSSRPIKCERW